MFKKFLWLLTIFCLALPVSAEERRKPVTIEGKSILPLRILTRPFSNIYTQKDASGATVQENVPAFQPFYVYTSPSAEDLELQEGWYEVGQDNRGGVLGWMQTKDVLEWKQTMCLAYTHPEGRSPVLMFANRRPLADLTMAGEEVRTKEVEKLYAVIDSGLIPEGFPIRSVEPKRAVDISTQFYLLPILAFEELEIGGREGRLLQLAAATASGPDARESTDISQNKDYLTEANLDAAQASEEARSQMKMDVVFVSDTTVSMRPYIKATLDVIKQVALNLGGDPATADALRFGVWGYRDPVGLIPGIGYTTNNYTPTLLPSEDFVNVLAQVDVTKVDSDDYAEDVFSGINDAITKTAWTDEAIRFIVLLGDAPGHDLGHKYNASGHSTQTLRAIANDSSVYLYTMHIKAPIAKKYHESAEMQFRELSANRGMQGESAYSSVSSKDLPGFTQISMVITHKITSMLSAAKQGNTDQTLGPKEGTRLSGMVPESAQPEAIPAAVDKKAPSAEASAGALAQQMVKAAMVDWIGKQSGAKAPRDIVAWATDKDLINPEIPAMEVRLLMSKQQLDSLNTILKEIMAAGLRGRIGGEDFFTALQATSAMASRDPNLIKNAKTIADTGLVPEFLSGLPYHSNLMSMNNDLWMSWSIDEQDEFLNELEAKVQAYQSIHDRPEGWVTLNPGDDPDEHVYPVSLELLP
ncbi:MAG: VWA domain-containing protein [Desulfobacteraceae bacterium]|nr:VWA domain-containing protein [Desulfobacteraceae bacterium]